MDSNAICAFTEEYVNALVLAGKVNNSGALYANILFRVAMRYARGGGMFDAAPVITVEGLAQLCTLALDDWRTRHPVY